MFKLVYPKFWQQKTTLSYLLWPLSQIYLSLGIVRYLIAKPVRFKAKVICVGNITVGGTGKTQVVIWLAEFLTERKINFIIITKGYKGLLKVPVIVDYQHNFFDVGDESILLSKYGKVIAAKKIDQAEKLVNELNPQVIIVDDGMQNPNFHKDLCLVVFDGIRGLGNRFLIPAGPLRQKLSQGLSISDALIIFNKDKLDSSIELHNASKSVFSATTIPCSNEFNHELNYLAFCSIGNPEKFFHTLKAANFELIETKVFPDHHSYTSEEIKSLIDRALKYNATLITTTKDYVKIPKEFLNSNIKCLDTKLVIDNENELKNIIDEKIIY